MKRLYDFFLEEKGGKTVAILFSAGILLLFLSGSFFGSSSPGKTAKTAANELEEYSSMLESNLEHAITTLTGDKKATVMITLESTFENVYASDASMNEAVTADKTDRKSEKQLVLTGSSASSQSPVTVKKIPPKIKGAAIVCRYGGDERVRKEIISLATAVLNISESKIYVTGGN